MKRPALLLTLWLVAGPSLSAAEPPSGVQRPVLDEIDTSVILGARLNLSF